VGCIKWLSKKIMAGFKDNPGLGILPLGGHPDTGCGDWTRFKISIDKISKTKTTRSQFNKGAESFLKKTFCKNTFTKKLLERFFKRGVGIYSLAMMRCRRC